MRDDWRGLIAAPFTPLRREDGEINPGVVGQQARALAEAGCRGAFVCGTTGEGLSLTLTERMLLADAWRKAAPPSPSGLRVIVHVGHLCLPDARLLASHAEKIGADAVGAFAPCFFRPTTLDDLVDWCVQIAGAAPRTPFFYYHIPSMTGVDFRMADFLPRAAAGVPTFAGVKYTHDDLDDLAATVRLAGERHAVLFGRDEMLLSALRAGAVGAVGSTYNYAAPLYRRLIAAFAAGRDAEAEAEQARAAAFIDVMRRHGGQAANKVIQEFCGVPVGPVRAPLRALSDAERESLRAELAALDFFDLFGETAKNRRTSVPSGGAGAE